MSIIITQRFWEIDFSIYSSFLHYMGMEGGREWGRKGERNRGREEGEKERETDPKLTISSRLTC